MVEARAMLGQQDRAEAAFAAAIGGLSHGVGILPEMIDPKTGVYLGNLPQGLSHLALIQVIATLGGAEL